MTKKTVLVIILFFSYINLGLSEDVLIKFKVENEIITNQDIINEINYLISLNQDLENLSRDDLKQLASKSLIKEKIKFLQLKNFFDLEKEDEDINRIIYRNLFSTLNLNSKNELKNYFLKYNLDFNDILYKYKVEILWNKLIYDKYITKVQIDKKKLRNQISNEISNREIIKEYFIREIMFNVNSNENLDQKIKDIKNIINDKGFSVAANIFSLSPSSKNGGRIGWVKKTQLSKKILANISALNIGDITDPIEVSGGYLILNLENKRDTQVKVNLENELKLLINKETDRQLNQYSTIFFNRIKKSIIINEI